MVVPEGINKKSDLYLFLLCHCTLSVLTHFRITRNNSWRY
ncbi:hypothetical protein HMPREF0880_04381 [Yokenella regensburgei ATCC 43003]|nr:hypothetical protein HMPREF0880_04381 [Yokenella regensburgei ATCC 43003]